MVKETGKFDQERRVQSTRFAHFWSVHKGDAGCLLALAGRYKPPTSFCHKPYEVIMELESRAPQLLHTCHVIHSYKHTIELVKYSRKRVRSLGEQRTRALSKHPYLVLKNLRWAPKMKGCCWTMKDTRILGLQRRRIQSRARDEAWLLRAFV